MISFLAWIIEHVHVIGWLALCMAMGGFLTPYVLKRYSFSNLDVLTWIGGFLGFSVGFIAYLWGALDETLSLIGAGIIFAGVMGGYWTGIAPRIASNTAQQKNWILKHTLQRYRFQTFFEDFITHVVLIAWSLIVLAPFVTMLMNSVKPKRQIFRTPFEFPNSEIRTWDGYKNAWLDGNFDTYFKNSLIVSINSILLILVVGTLAAYALANWQSRKSSAMYLYFTAGLMVPIRLGTINIITLIQDLGLGGKLEGLILIYVAMGIPIAVFVLTTFIRNIPRDLMDAARIDGASELQILWHIIVPLVRPAMATVAIFNFIPIYNDLWFPLILTRDENVRTVTYGVSLLFGQYQTDWNAILSILSLASVPTLILYLLMSKQFIKGLTAGAIKG